MGRQLGTFEKLPWPEGPATLVSSQLPPAFGQTHHHNSTVSNPSQSTALFLQILGCFGRAKDENTFAKKSRLPLESKEQK